MSAGAKEYRSGVFWVSDVNAAASELVRAALAHHPADREQFLRDVVTVAKSNRGLVAAQENPDG